MTAEQAAPSSIRIASIEIENYKSLDKLQLALPAPSTTEQLDVFVLGSKNGVGKSSVLECCAIALLSGFSPGSRIVSERHQDPEFYRFLIRSGSKEALSKLTLAIDDRVCTAAVRLFPNGDEVTSTGEQGIPYDDEWRRSHLSEDDLLQTILGRNSEPVIRPPLLMFPSYRKVLEGGLALESLLDPRAARRGSKRLRTDGTTSSLSTFKIALVQAMMAQSGMFEGVMSRSNSGAVIVSLNGLLREFAGGTVDKLRPGPDGTLELRVSPVDGGPSFSFDGLSSGQKEIIATLFLIWSTTQHRPSIVLIDEPELHLNAEWQRIFVSKLAELAPKNQYILATHSEEIFASVTKDRRLMLRKE